MLSGDIVLFNLAVDQRNGAQRATNVQLHRLIEEQKDKNAREMVSIHVCAYLPGILMNVPVGVRLLMCLPSINHGCMWI